MAVGGSDGFRQPREVVVVVMTFTRFIREYDDDGEDTAPAPYFSMDYLDPDNKRRIIKHLEQGGVLKCHHKDCNSFEVEFKTLYEYNVHCHTNHPRKPLHPDPSYIEALNRLGVAQLEPRDNPWEWEPLNITDFLDDD